MHAWDNPYKAIVRGGFMSYEELLNVAYEEVKPVEVAERFEVVKAKGHHEGVRTVITNFGQIVASVRRPSDHFVKFLCKELASQCEVKGDSLILSRKLASKDVNDKVSKYVDCFVVCPKCGKPDTELVSEGPKNHLKCLACGEKREIHKI